VSPRRALVTTFAVAAASITVATASTSATTVPPEEPAGDDCAWVDAAAVAELPVAEALDALSELSLVSGVIAESGAAEQFAGEGPLTILAPSNAAISEIPQNVLDAILADDALLHSILGRHVIPGAALSAAELAEGGSFESLNGKVTFALDGETLVVNDGEASVECGDIATANAVVHVIDHVLQPAGDAMCPGGTSVPGTSAPGASVPMTSAPGASVPGSSVPC
jgi:uncharacterized surface protein with fasciclin (FAS1) repeats